MTLAAIDIIQANIMQQSQVTAAPGMQGMLTVRLPSALCTFLVLVIHGHTLVLQVWRLLIVDVRYDIVGCQN